MHDTIDIISKSRILSDVLKKAEAFAPVPRPLVIRGERGTGKELLAHFIHGKSGFARGPFVAINCAVGKGERMRSELTYLLLICFVIFAGCATVSPPSRSESYYEKKAFAQEIEPVSLFSSDSAILSNADIKQILEYRYAPQNQNRIGILNIGQNSLFEWSDEISKSGAEVQSKLVSKLRSSHMVFDASYLPGLLIPDKKTVGHFREAGARYQADLLLIYRASFRTYEKYKFPSPQKIKSYCTVEAVLLDTRTGIVPFATTGTRDFITEQSDQDYNFKDTMRRSELTALEYVLEEVGEQVVSFLGSTNR